MRPSLPGASAAVAILAALAGCTTAAPAPDGPQAVLARYVAAANAGDLGAIRQLIAPDVERSDFVGCHPGMDNPDCLAHYIEATIVRPRARIEVLSQSVDGEVVDARLAVRSELYRQAGAERILGRDVLRVRQQQILSFRFVPDFSDEQTARFFATLGIGPRATRPVPSP